MIVYDQAHPEKRIVINIQSIEIFYDIEVRLMMKIYSTRIEGFSRTLICNESKCKMIFPPLGLKID